MKAFAILVVVALVVFVHRQKHRPLPVSDIPSRGIMQISLSSFQWPFLQLQQLYSARLVDRQIDSIPLIRHYMLNFQALWKAAHEDVPFVLITSHFSHFSHWNGTQPISAEVDIVYFPSPFCTFTQAKNTSRLRDITIRGSYTAYLVRPRAIRKKLFRLLPISTRFEKALSTIFHVTLSSTQPMGPEDPTNPTDSTGPVGVVAVNAGNATRCTMYRSKALRYFILAPLSLEQKKEVFEFLRVMFERHAHAKWVFYSNAHRHSYHIVPLPRKVTFLSDEIEILFWSIDPASPVSGDAWVRTFGALKVRRIWSVEWTRYTCMLIRTQAFRDRGLSLLPITEELGTALCSHFRVFHIIN